MTNENAFYGSSFWKKTKPNTLLFILVAAWRTYEQNENSIGGSNLIKHDEHIVRSCASGGREKYETHENVFDVSN